MRNPISCSPCRLQVVSLLTVAITFGGCTSLTEPKQDPASVQKETCDCSQNLQAKGAGKKALDVGEQRQLLNEGYSLLHTDAGKLDLIDLLLYVKSSSDEFKAVVKEVSAFAGKVKQDLEHIEKNYPAVRIDLDPLPVMEKRKRWDIGKDRVIDFAPGVGRGGRDYERTVLISLMNGINHQSHLCKVLAAEEPEASLKKSLTDIEQGYDVLYRRIEALLMKTYFKS